MRILYFIFLILFFNILIFHVSATQLITEEINDTVNFTLINFSGRLALASFWVSYDPNTAKYIGYQRTLENYTYYVMDDLKDKGILKVIVYSVNPPILSNPVIISMKFKVKPGTHGWVSILKVDELKDFYGKDILNQSPQDSIYSQIDENKTEGTEEDKRTEVVERTEIKTDKSEKTRSGNETQKPEIKVNETLDKPPINKDKNIEKHGTDKMEKTGVDDHLKKDKEKYNGEETPTTTQINTTQKGRFVLGDNTYTEIYLWILGVLVIYVFLLRRNGK